MVNLVLPQFYLHFENPAASYETCLSNLKADDKHHIENLKALKKYLHHAYDLAEIDGTSHFPMIENPVEFNEALRLHVNEIVETVLETVNR